MLLIRLVLLWGIGILGGAAAMAEPALLTASRNAADVKIDGYLNDAAWKKAPGASLIPNRQEAGRQFEAGCFQVTYDQDNFYIGGTLEQSFLDPSANKLDLVKNKAQADNDSRIFRDDEIELFLQVPGAPEYWHLAVNSDGKIYRSRGQGYGLGNPQPASGIQVKTRRTERSWSFEVAVPLELLGGEAVKNGRRLALGVFRNNTPKSEITAWSPASPNLHQPAQWGEIVLEETAPAVQGVGLHIGRENTEFSLRMNEGRYRFAGALNAALLDVKKGWRALVLQGKPQVAGGTVQLAVLNENDGKTLWRSPQFKTAAIAAAAGKMDLTIPGSFKIFINGELFADGQDGIARDFILPGKINTIGIEAAGGNQPFSGTLQLGRLKIEADQWLTSKEASSMWLDADYDVSGWQLYGGKPINGRTYFRFTVVRNHALFAPQRPDGKLHLANGTVDAWTLRIGSPAACKLPDYELNVVVPEALEVPRYDFDRRTYSRYKHMFSNQVENSRRLLNFKFHSPMPHLAYNWGYNVVNFLVKPNFPKSAENTVLPVQIWQRARGLAEYPQEYELHVLPELKSGNPKKIVINLWDTERGNCFTVDEMKLMLDTFVRAGVNYAGICDTGRPEEDLAQSRRAHELGMKSMFAHNGNFSQFLLERLNAKPEYKIVNPVYPREAWSPGMCPLIFLSDPWVKAYLEKMFPDFDVFADDIERGIHKSCLCENCRRELAKRFQWPEVPDAGTIYRKYQKELIEFQIDLNRRMLDYQIVLAGKVNPNLKSSFYSGYDSLETAMAYGVDWQRYRDVDYPMAGYALSSEIIGNTRKVLEGKPVICGYILDSGFYEKPQSPQNIKAILFYQLRNSGFGGVLVWSWRELDGRGYHALADFARGVAAFEPFLSEANAINPEGICSGMQKDAVSVYKWNGQYLILAVNMQNKSAILPVRLPEGVAQAEIYDFYRSRTQMVKSGFSVEIPAVDVGLILIKPQ
ncbi:MAG: sugar-binding protein [Victivallaceae bacterium]|jgi:hypothetical protein